MLVHDGEEDKVIEAYMIPNAFRKIMYAYLYGQTKVSSCTQ